MFALQPVSVTLADPQTSFHALIFDSGVGGLSVSRDMRKHLPDLRQSYLADDAFRPYGNKSEADLRSRLPGLLRPVCDMLSPDIVVIACNTASTTALPTIRAALDVPVVGVVPAIKPAAARTREQRIAVLGTPGTIQRNYIDELIEAFASECEVRLKGSVRLVEQAERKLRGDGVDPDVIASEIASLFQGDRIDSVVLACTHFPLLREELTAAAPYPVQWIDSGNAIARRVEDLLSKIPLQQTTAPAIPTAFSTASSVSPTDEHAFAKFGFNRLVPLGSP